MSKPGIDDCRARIDELDDELLCMFNRRAAAVIELGRLKAAAGKKLYDPVRERDIFVRLTGKNPGPLSADAIVRLFERIIDESRRIERSEAYGGSQGDESE